MDVFSLVAKLTLDSSEYDRNLDDAKSGASSFGDKLKSGLATAAKVGAAAITAASGAIAALTKNSVENYAEYEQLVGGVETLFKSSADLVQKYASNAYKTAGLSANEYMETVTSFSASLLQSLGGDTEQAAKIGDMAISDMADNANKMGTAMESIQNAYQGFAKQNYTMLDNLKLGYGGTKSEMERLLEDATALSGIEYDIDSLSDVYEAIHIIQESLDITGTTAKEASETISGSLSAMKSAWSNLVTGVADENANFSALVDNFVESAATVGENIIPRVEQALTGVGRLVEGLAPAIVNAVPTLVSNVLPSLLQSAASLVESIGGAIIDNLPVILDTGLELILTLANGIADNLPELIPTIVDVVMQIVDTLTQPSTITNLVNAAVKIMLGLASGLIKAIPKLIAAIPTIIKNLVNALIDTIPMIIEAGVQLLVSLVENLPAIIAGIVKALPEIIMAILNGLGELGGMLANLFTAAWEDVKSVFAGVGEFFSGVWNGITSAFSSVGSWFKDTFKRANENTKAVWSSVGNWFGDRWSDIKGAFSSVGNWFKDTFTKANENTKAAWETVGNWFSDRWDDITNALSNVGSWFKDTFTKANENTKAVWSSVGNWFGDRWSDIKGAFSSAGNWFKETFTKANENTKTVWSKIGNWFSDRWGDVKGAFSNVGSWFSDKFSAAKEGVVRVWDNIKSNFSNIWGKIKEGFSIGDALQWGRDMIQNFINGIKQMFTNLRNTVSNVAQTVKNFLGFSEPKLGPLSNFHTYAPDMMKLFAKGIRDNEKLVTDQIEKSFDFGTRTIDFAANSTVLSGGAGFASGGSPRNITRGDVIFNIYGAPGQDEEVLAERIAEIFENDIMKEATVWA